MVKLTKTSLRSEQMRHQQLLKYLPTLQLKKALLQLEVQAAKTELQEKETALKDLQEQISRSQYLLEETSGVEFKEAVFIKEVRQRMENIAGVEVPYFEGVDFHPFEYSLLETPPWTDILIARLRELEIAKVHVAIAEEKKKALEKELREVSIRVNLFEKILIPRAERAIKKIKVFLGDQELAAVARAKVAKEILGAS